MKIGIVTWNSAERHKLFMEQAYPEMETFVVADSASDEEKIQACRDAEAIIMVAASLSVDVLKGCPNVKLLQGIGAGFDKVDIKAINAWVSLTPTTAAATPSPWQSSPCRL